MLLELNKLSFHLMLALPLSTLTQKLLFFLTNPVCSYWLKRRQAQSGASSFVQTCQTSCAAGATGIRLHGDTACQRRKVWATIKAPQALRVIVFRFMFRDKDLTEHEQHLDFGVNSRRW